MITTAKGTISTIDQIGALLNEGRAQDALDLIHHSGQTAPEVENARGVCLMRLGRIDDAVSILRDVAFQGHMCIQPDTPAVFLTNFATAMLMAGQPDAAIAAIEHMSDKQHPTVAKIRTAIRRWRACLSWPERCLYYFGKFPGKSVEVDWTAGDLS